MCKQFRAHVPTIWDLGCASTSMWVLILWANCSECKRFGILANASSAANSCVGVCCLYRAKERAPPNRFSMVGQSALLREWLRPEKQRVKEK